MTSQNRPDPRPDPRDPVVRERRRRGMNPASEFEFDLSKIPDGLSYEWKRETVVGQHDVSHQMALAGQGFLPVEAKAHPEMMPPGYKGPIRRGDMILMERPIELRREAEEEDRARAKEQVRLTEAQLAEKLPDTKDRHASVSRTVETHRAVPE